MTLYAGDIAWYRRRGRLPEKVEVIKHTRKRVKIVLNAGCGYRAGFTVRYVKEESLERAGGGAAR